MSLVFEEQLCMYCRPIKFVSWG